MLLEQEETRVDLQDKFGQTALHWAAKNGCLELVEALLTKKVNTNLQDRCGRTALHWAAFWGDSVTIVLALLKNKCDPNLREQENSKTALHWAAERGQLAIVLALLENKGEPKLMDHKGQTALHLAAKGLQLANIQALLQRMTIDAINATDNDGNTAFGYAVTERECTQWNQIEVIKTFLTHPGINIHANYSENASYKNIPLNYLFLLAGPRYAKVFQILLTNPDFDVNVCHDGQPFCHELLEQGYDDTLLMLLTGPSKRVNLQLKNKKKQTLYDLALAKNKIQVINILESYKQVLT